MSHRNRSKKLEPQFGLRDWGTSATGRELGKPTHSPESTWDTGTKCNPFGRLDSGRTPKSTLSDHCISRLRLGPRHGRSSRGRKHPQRKPPRRIKSPRGGSVRDLTTSSVNFLLHQKNTRETDKSVTMLSSPSPPLDSVRLHFSVLTEKEDLVPQKVPRQ